MPNHRHFGQQKEQQACAYLTKRGLRLIDKNYQCKCGELDLIMQDQEVLVFVEVRYRKHQDYGSAIESITPGKQRKIVRTAKYYLQSKSLFDRCSCRFDVVLIEPKLAFNEDQFLWLRDAFWERF